MTGAARHGAHVADHDVEAALHRGDAGIAPQLYGGSVSLGSSPLGGLAARLDLPAADRG